jgi:predicted GH43/DUF377 family glycosyl hydrolase
LFVRPADADEGGWLILYHGVRTTASGSVTGWGWSCWTWRIPPRDPADDEWIFGPKAPYEREGDVDDVVFPCGWVKKGEKVFMYYGAADSRLCLATADYDELVGSVLKCPSLR